MGLKDIYDKHYKKIMIIPAIIILLALAQIIFQIATTGDFVDKGIALKGGNTVRIETKYADITELKDFLSEKFPTEDFDVRISTTRGIQDAVIIEATEGAEINLLLGAIKEKLGDTVPPVENMASEVGSVSSAFSTNFFKSAMIAIIVAFILMAIIVFYYFRIPIPSLAVILAVVCDMLVTVAVFNIIGMKLSTGGIAALLMLIGYSVDTDILLSTRVLKYGQGTTSERIVDAVKTGLTMTGTTITAVLIGLIFAKSEIIKEIMIILLIGLIADVIMTWMQNAPIIIWYLERKAKKHAQANETVQADNSVIKNI